MLSEFIIYYVHHRDFGHPAAVKRFLVRRVERIYPTYCIIFAGVGIIALAIPAFRDGVPTDMFVLLKTLLLVPQDPAVVGGTGAPLIIVAWSLHYEIVFYVIFGICIISPAAGLTSVAVLGVWWLATATSWRGPEFILHFLTPHYFAIFGFGVASAWMSVRHMVRAPALWAAVGTTIYAACAVFEVGEMFVKNLLQSPGRSEIVSLGYGFGSALLAAGLVGLEARRQRAVPNWLVRIGDASYVLYLAHFPIISACAKVLTILADLIQPQLEIALANVAQGIELA